MRSFLNLSLCGNMLGVRKETQFMNVQFSTTKRDVFGENGWGRRGGDGPGARQATLRLGGPKNRRNCSLCHKMSIQEMDPRGWPHLRCPHAKKLKTYPSEAAFCNTPPETPGAPLGSHFLHHVFSDTLTSNPSTLIQSGVVTWMGLYPDTSQKLFFAGITSLVIFTQLESQVNWVHSYYLPVGSTHTEIPTSIHVSGNKEHLVTHVIPLSHRTTPASLTPQWVSIQKLWSWPSGTQNAFSHWHHVIYTRWVAHTMPFWPIM